MNKDDGNTAAIRKALIAAGATVERIQRVPGPGLKGVPDLLVGFQGRNFLLEVKMPGEKLTNDQPAWHERWCGKVDVVHTPEEAIAALRVLTFEINPLPSGWTKMEPPNSPARFKIDPMVGKGKCDCPSCQKAPNV